MDNLRELLRELEARPLVADGPRRRRLPKPVSQFIRRKIEALRAEGRTIKQAISMAYHMAKRRGIL